jgi:hypothetical protein
VLTLQKPRIPHFKTYPAVDIRIRSLILAKLSRHYPYNQIRTVSWKWQITSETSCIWIKETLLITENFTEFSHLCFTLRRKIAYISTACTQSYHLVQNCVCRNAEFLRTCNMPFNLYYNHSGNTRRKFKITEKKDCNYWLKQSPCAFLNKVLIIWPNTTTKSSILVLYYSQHVSAVQISHHQVGVVQTTRIYRDRGLHVQLFTKTNTLNLYGCALSDD